MSENNINQDMCKKHFRTLVFNCYTAYVKKHHPDYDLDKLVTSLGLSLDYLSNPSKWTSVEFDYQFTKRLTEELNDSDIPFKAGQLTYAKESLGETLAKVVKIGSCLNYIYKIAPRAVSFFNNIFSVTLLDHSANTFYLYEVRPQYHMLESDAEVQTLTNNLHNIYQNFIGHFCAISAIKHNDPTCVSPFDILEESEEVMIFQLRPENIPLKN